MKNLSKEITSKKVKVVTLNDIKDLIKLKIEQKYGMTINEFSQSAYLAKIGIKPSSFNVYMSTSSATSNSYPAISKVLHFLKLPPLMRRVEVIKVNHYYVDEK